MCFSTHRKAVTFPSHWLLLTASFTALSSHQPYSAEVVNITKKLLSVCYHSIVSMSDTMGQNFAFLFFMGKSDHTPFASSIAIAIAIAIAAGASIHFMADSRLFENDDGKVTST